MKYLAIFILLVSCPALQAQCSNGVCYDPPQVRQRVATNNRHVLTIGMINRVVVTNGNCNTESFTQAEPNSRRGPIRNILKRLTGRR